MKPQHKLVFELGWREYFRHVWAHRGDAIFRSLHRGPLPDGAYADEVPADVREARTGVPVIDRAVRQLYAEAYLHNHARLWLASYLVHLRKCHWRAGADWLYGHLLDGDLASNHLSWQWVAGTASSKPYLFNAENVARYAPPDWHSAGSVVDAPYESLDAIARSHESVICCERPDGVREPALRSVPPPALDLSAPDAAAVRDRDVWLVHPWALRDAPQDLGEDTVCIGVFVDEFHRAHPWSETRWAFVGERMQALAPRCWFGDAAALQDALAGARSVATVNDPHLGSLLPSGVTQRTAPTLFAPVASPCDSFSRWWTQTLRGVHTLADMPGMAALATEEEIDADLRPTLSSGASPESFENLGDCLAHPDHRAGDRRARWHRP